MAKTFDFNEFKKTKYENRVNTLTLKAFGDTGEDVEIKYKNMTAAEMCEMETMLSEATQQKIDKLVSAFFGATGNKASDEMLDALGLKEKKPLLLIKKLFIFESGIVGFPDNWSRVDTVKFANAHPVEFNDIVSAIWNATCMGQQVKKKQSGSGKQPESETTSQSQK